MSDRPASSAEDRVTLEEFARMAGAEDDVRLHLVRGRVVREPRPDADHVRVREDLRGELERFVRDRDLGVVTGGLQVHLSTHPPTVRFADLAFMAKRSVPPEGLPAGVLHIVPELVVEIVPLSRPAGEIQEMVPDYLDAGARQVWVVDPGPGRVTVHRSREDARVFTAGAEDVLEGGDLLPGFRLDVAELLEG